MGAMGRRAAVGVVMVTMLLVVLGGVAWAHSGEESHIFLQVYDTTIEGRVEFPINDFNEVLGMSIPNDVDAAAAALDDVIDDVHAYTLHHLSMGADGVDWPLAFDGYEILDTENGLYFLFPFVVDVDFAGQAPRQFTVRYDAILEAKPERSALLVIEHDWRSGTFGNGENPLLRFTPEQTTQLVTLDDESTARAIGAVIGLGVEHIQIGSDHILFILALLLPAVLVFRLGRGWEPAGSFGSSLWRVAKIATSFTIAHTITLTLGGLGIVELSPRLVEPIIAISIALAALHNVRPVFFNKEWSIAFGFGLFHGFGFASLLGDLGLDRSNRLISLLGFNLGIELGQLAIILLVFPALYLLRRVRAYVALMKMASVVLTLIAVGWFADRAFSLDFGVDRVVDPFLAWPRPLWIVAFLTVAAVVYYEIENSAGRLLPLPDDLGPVREEEETVAV